VATNFALLMINVGLPSGAGIKKAVANAAAQTMDEPPAASS